MKYFAFRVLARNLIPIPCPLLSTYLHSIFHFKMCNMVYLILSIFLLTYQVIQSACSLYLTNAHNTKSASLLFRTLTRSLTALHISVNFSKLQSSHTIVFNRQSFTTIKKHCTSHTRSIISIYRINSLNFSLTTRNSWCRDGCCSTLCINVSKVSSL